MTASPFQHVTPLLRPIAISGRVLATALTLGMTSLAGCHSAPSASAPEASASASAGMDTAARPVFSLKELMDSTVDAAADGVWDSVGTVVNAKGVDRHQPRTDEDWHAVRRHAVTLVEAMNLVVLPGRRAAPAGAKAGLGELSPEEIDALVAQNRPEFEQYATATRDVAMDLVKAVDRKDTAKIVELGGVLDERCESCHVRFWYPNSARPGQ